MIREANKHDMPELLQMMRDYSTQTPVPALQAAAAHDEAHVANLMTQMMAGRGFVLIDNESRGFIAALITTNVWCPEVYELHELAWWVKPEHRNGTVGGRLWKEFDRLATDLIDDGRIDVAVTAVMANNTWIDYTKRGYAPMQATFFRVH
jgi:N-acetylglutamate synthase-like GNAT family acetyltransferase